MSNIVLRKTKTKISKDDVLSKYQLVKVYITNQLIFLLNNLMFMFRRCMGIGRYKTRRRI